MTTPTPPPWDSPKVETRKSVPNELDMVVSVRPGLGPSADVSGLDEPAAVDRLPALGIGGSVVDRLVGEEFGVDAIVPGLDFVDDVVGTPAQLRGDEDGNPLRDLRTAIHRLDGDTHPAGQYVLQMECTFVPDGVDGLGSEVTPTGKDFVVTGFVVGDVEHGGNP